MTAHSAENNKTKALSEAIRRAAVQLAGVNLAERCRLLGLPLPDENGTLRFELFHRPVTIAPPDFEGVMADTGKSLHPADRLLVLHYLLCDRPVHPTGKWITYRRLPGGQFYYEPVRSRTVVPLVRAIGNDLDLLRKRLARMATRPLEAGDVGVAIRVLGPVEIGLAYHAGDEEFPPTAEILFDESLRRIYNTEDAAALASRICLALANEKCESCSGCGLCDAG
jgi:hypothetical protein